jgi:choline dehydrogenase-like flavoprotein
MKIEAADSVVVCGAGLSGSLAALLLAQRGQRVQVLEKRPDPRRQMKREMPVVSQRYDFVSSPMYWSEVPLLVPSVNAVPLTLKFIQSRIELFFQFNYTHDD